jgi:hypothetical protein
MKNFKNWLRVLYAQEWDSIRTGFHSIDTAVPVAVIL